MLLPRRIFVAQMLALAACERPAPRPPQHEPNVPHKPPAPTPHRPTRYRLEPVSDAAVLYSFHMYEPRIFSIHENKGKYRYPGAIPVDESPGAATQSWDAAAVRKAMAAPFAWSEKHDIPRNRILVGELGCNRLGPGAAEYLEHVVSFLEEQGVHWAFHSFREDEWDGMDYELGDKATNKTRGDNPLWRVISSRLSVPRWKP